MAGERETEVELGSADGLEIWIGLEWEVGQDGARGAGPHLASPPTHEQCHFY